jgi:hypothetical protein
MIQKELAFRRERSGTVTVPGANSPFRNPAPPASWPLRGFGGGGTRRRNRMEDSVKLTDTQLRLLAAASKRDDRALERPPHLTGGVAGKVVAKLLAEGLVEEVQSRGSLPVWRRDRGQGAHPAHHQARASGHPDRRRGGCGWRIAKEATRPVREIASTHPPPPGS